MLAEQLNGERKQAVIGHTGVGPRSVALGHTQLYRRGGCLQRPQGWYPLMTLSVG